MLAQRLSGFAGIRNWCPCPWNVGVEVSDELLWCMRARNASHYHTHLPAAADPSSASGCARWRRATGDSVTSTAQTVHSVTPAVYGAHRERRRVHPQKCLGRRQHRGTGFSSSFRPAGDITLAGRRHRPAEVPKGTIQEHLWLPTASLRFHINMVLPTDPLGVRACPIDAFGGLGKAQ